MLLILSSNIRASFCIRQQEGSMLPRVGGIPTYFVMWAVAAIAGVGVAMWHARAQGFQPRRALTALLVLVAAVVIGSKALFLVERLVFPEDDLFPVSYASWWAGALVGYRNPGGLLLFAAALPLACRIARLPTLAFADSVIPAMGIAIAAFRLGCFLNGCCFGTPSDLPFAVTYPADGRAFVWQVLHGLLAREAAHSLAVQPVQLYFVGLGAALYLLARRWQVAPAFSGAVLAKFYLVYCIGTFAFDSLQAVPPRVNLILTGAGAVLLASVLLLERARRAGGPVIGGRRPDRLTITVSGGLKP